MFESHTYLNDSFDFCNKNNSNNKVSYSQLVKHSKCRKNSLQNVVLVPSLKNSVHDIKRFEISKKASERTCSVHKVYLRVCVFFFPSRRHFHEKRTFSPFPPLSFSVFLACNYVEFVRHLGPNNSMLVHFKHQFLFKLPTIKFLFLIFRAWSFVCVG